MRAKRSAACTESTSAPSKQPGGGRDLGFGDAGHRRAHDPRQLQRRLHVGRTEVDHGLEDADGFDVEVGEDLLVRRRIGEPERPPEAARQLSGHAGYVGHLRLVVTPAVRNEKAVHHEQIDLVLLLGPGDLVLGGTVLDEKTSDPVDCDRPAPGRHLSRSLRFGVGRRADRALEDRGTPALADRIINLRMASAGSRAPSRTNTTCSPMGISTPWSTRHLEQRPGRLHPLGHHAHVRQDVGDGPAAPELDADGAIAAQRARARGHQITHPRQPGDGQGLASHGHTQSPELGQAPGDESST